MKQVFALLGEKLGHSWSPEIHRMILERMELTGSYTLLEVRRADLPEAVGALRTLGFSGTNVTIPYKQEIMPYLSDISPEAKRIGAVNTIQIGENGKSTGHNTDYFGFLSMLETQGLPPAGRSAVVLGTGGAAVSAVAALLDAGAASVTVVGRDAEKLLLLQNRFPAIQTALFDQPERIIGELLVNTTPVGMYPAVEVSPLPVELVRRFSAVADCIYNPTPTLLVKMAQQAGIPACCGLSMLVFQAVKAQEIWQGRAFPQEAAQEICRTLEQKIIGAHP